MPPRIVIESGLIPCRGCGQRMLLVRRPQTGKLSPCEPGWKQLVPDPEGPLRGMRLDGTTFRAHIAGADEPGPIELGMVLHFTTCPRRDQFSKVSRKRVLSEVKNVIQSLK